MTVYVAYLAPPHEPHGADLIPNNMLLPVLAFGLVLIAGFVDMGFWPWLLVGVIPLHVKYIRVIAV